VSSALTKNAKLVEKINALAKIFGVKTCRKFLPYYSTNNSMASLAGSGSVPLPARLAKRHNTTTTTA
jgi:hypothetical protein